MKKNIIMLLAFTCIAFANASVGQDVSINLLTQNSGQVNISEIVFLEVSVCNTSSSATVPNYKIRPQISAPGSIVTIPASGHILPAGWTIVSNTGSVIRLSNGTGTIEPNTCYSAFIALRGTTEGGPSIINGNMLFSTGIAPGSAPGAATPGDLSANNTSQSTVQVNTALPIVLGSFEAIITDCRAKINWHTEQEVNTLKFTIEKSTDANTWVVVADVPAAGNAGARRDYTATDTKVESKKAIYYRLKAIDKDGKFAYSNIVNVVNNCVAKKAIVFPNPVESGSFNVFISGFEDIATASLRSSDGRLVLIKKVTEGNNLFSVTALANGTYFLSIKDAAGNQIQQKVIVSR